MSSKQLEYFYKNVVIYYISLNIELEENHQLEYPNEKERIVQLETYLLSFQDATFLFLMLQFLMKNPNLEPDGKGFGKPKPSIPSRFSKRMKDILKSFKKKNYLKEITNYLISLYHNHPYKYRLLIMALFLLISSYMYYRVILKEIELLQLGYLSNYLMELTYRMRLIELFDRYKKAKFLKLNYTDHLPFQSVPVENSLNSLSNLQLEELKNVERALLENKLKGRLLLSQIFALAKELNLNPKSTSILILLATLVWRLQNDPSNTSSFVLFVQFLLKIFGSTDSSSWTDPNE